MAMDVAVTDLSGCKKSLSIVIPADIAEGEFNRRTKELAKQARLPGFRPGKAPPSIIKQRFQKEIKNEVVHELIEERLDDLIKDRGLVPISKPVVDKLEFELGSPLTLQISFEVWPEVNLTDYRDLTIQVKKSPEITDEEVTKVLEQHREEAASYVPVEERPIQTGDLEGINMEAMHQVRDNWVKLHEQDTTFTVGDSHVHAAFNENLLGLKPGDAKEFTIEYNNLYADKR